MKRWETDASLFLPLKEIFMFNEEFKKDYISYKTHITIVPDGMLTRLFNKMEFFENKFEKDLSCFTCKEIYYFMKMLNMTSTNSLIVINSTLALYTDWCLLQKRVPDGQNHYREIQLKLIEYCTNHTLRDDLIFTKDTIHQWVDELVNPCDQFILLAIFEGIRGKELCELVDLRLSDFNGNKITLYTGDNEMPTRTITVSDKLVHLAHQSASENTYYKRHIKNGDVYYSTISYLQDDSLILKNYPNVKSKVSSFQHGRRLIDKILRIAKIFEVDHLTVTNIAKSGEINFINERCRELKLSGKEYLYSTYFPEVVNQYNSKIVKSTFYRSYERYLER